MSDTFPEGLRRAAELYVGCVSGAMPMGDYLDAIRTAGFTEVKISKERGIQLPQDLLNAYLNDGERAALRNSGVRIISITVTGIKPGSEAGAEACCIPTQATPKSGCC